MTPALLTEYCQSALPYESLEMKTAVMIGCLLNIEHKYQNDLLPLDSLIPGDESDFSGD
jgi:hypothetical protein